MQLHVGPSVNNKIIRLSVAQHYAHADDYTHIMHERCFVRGLMRSWGPYAASLAAHRDAQLKVDLAGLLFAGPTLQKVGSLDRFAGKSNFTGLPLRCPVNH